MSDFVTREEFLQLAADVTTLRKWNDTANSPFWKRVLFRLDGWPRAAHVADGGHWPNGQRQCGRSWRPWHRWFYFDEVNLRPHPELWRGRWLRFWLWVNRSELT